MFKSIKRFFHNLFWKEKRVVKEDPKRNNFVGVSEGQNETLMRGVMAVKTGSAHFGEVIDLTPTNQQPVKEDDLISPNQAAYDIAAMLKGSSLTQEEKDELDKELTAALPDNFPDIIISNKPAFRRDLFNNLGSGKGHGFLDVNDYLAQEGFLTLRGAAENLAEAEKSGREDIIHAAKIEMTLTTLNANGFTISRSQMNQAFEAGFDLAYFDDAGIDPDLVISRLANVGVVIETESPTISRSRNELFVEGEIGYPIADPSAKLSSGVSRISQEHGRLLSDREYQARKHQLLEITGLERSPYHRPIPDEGTSIITPVTAEEAGDETYALESEHVMSQEAASMYRSLCNLKHHPDFQTPEARLNLGGILSALRSGSWEPGTGKVLDENSPVIQRLLGGGLQRGQLHILSAFTDPSKSQFHPSNNLQNEVNHLIAMDPGKFGAESHTEIDMVVKKQGDEIDCRVVKVKVVKARLKPLSKSEKSKMSKRRVKKESKKVLEPSRGKRRG